MQTINDVGNLLFVVVYCPAAATIYCFLPFVFCSFVRSRLFTLKKYESISNKIDLKCSAVAAIDRTS